MTECRRCGGKSQMFLCPKCETGLLEILTDLPWWLSRLTETALGQTRMSDNGGRKSARRRDLDGDAELAACIELLPANDDLDKARKARQKSALAHALATGGINARASELLGEIADSLQYWVKELCDARSVAYTRSPLARTTSPGSEYATWLRVNVAAISASEWAVDIAGDIESHRDDIVRIVNRPIRWWTLGPCPGWIERKREECGAELRAPADTEEIQCGRCKTQHNIHRLLLSRKSTAESEPMTWRTLTRYNRDLPAEFQVPPRTLQHWQATGKLCACGILDGDPLYSWIDVRLLMLQKPQRTMTGAAAHRGS